MDALTDNQRSSLREIFDKVAFANDDGAPSVGFKQLGFLLRAQGVFSTESEIRDMISEVDTTGSGVMGYEEFANLMSRSIKAEAEPFEEITDAFDQIGDGTWVTKATIKSAIESLGVPITDEEIDEMLAEADVDNNGKISREDFKFLMEQRHKNLKES
ncbi:hypothetical protein TrVE_jg3547 [Triparma verrucosa]|uniref:Calmodulin n=2 Tax=Triparma TaxID=722752 RepID=A0A9W7B1A8_9STRA|nr:hypothetical protein TrST_g13947 [Triparma strigata]GMI15465.1 hypothetical protein TrVE_jg3547 [Triparma verrucosa]